MAFEWLNEDSRKFLSRDYLQDDESPEDRVRDIAETAEKYLIEDGFADKFYDYMGKGYYSLASPIWSNYGRTRGMPISCFGSRIDDDLSHIFDTNSEVAIMSKNGGGTSSYFGDIRPRGSVIRDSGKSDGAVSFMRLFDTTINIAKQAEVRRGSIAAYLPIDHGDIEEFLKIKHEGNSIQSVFPGVTVKDYWMEEMIAGDPYKRDIWAKVLHSRASIGLPYIFFHDNANRNKPQVYKDNGLEIVSSNLCNEISLPAAHDESFVCCLSAINIVHIEEIMKTDAVRVLLRFLDTVITEFIDKASTVKHMERAVKFAEKHRALGLGVLGWHTYLQNQMTPFGSFAAKSLTEKIFSFLKDETDAESRDLAIKFGEPEILTGYGQRNTTKMAGMPTKSSSFILGQISQSFEPYLSNYYVRDLAKIKHVFKNPALEKLLSEKGKNTPEIWELISKRNGSVQHLDFLSDLEKEVFKTFGEISQGDILSLATQRQKYIDQGQSINLQVHPDAPIKDINKMIIDFWKEGGLGLYYQKSTNAAQEFSRSLMECSTCSG